MLQLRVDSVSVQVQSRGRSVAELQVSGASATLTRRPQDTGLSLSVHGLLLVDALQTHGPDYELLLASHRRVALDSLSGSLRDSEPASPTSPASPDPGTQAHRAHVTSPLALSTALSGLASSVQDEALISLEYTEVLGQDPVRIANIQFNSLDITANQETIVELLGFARRVCPSEPAGQRVHSPEDQPLLGISTPPDVRTELTFDFHRLNVLVMRAVTESCARKVATATVCDARIRATVDAGSLAVCGSLGGLQLLDLTPEGSLHRRVVSVGRDPLVEPPHTYHYNEYGFYTHDTEDTHDTEALQVVINRRPKLDGPTQEIEIRARMASVWYTHSPQLLTELQSCVAEFQQYLSNVARSIKAAASEMALGLVHPRHHELYQNHRAAGSQHGLGDSPAHRRRQSSVSVSWHRRTHSYDDDLTIDVEEAEENARDVQLLVDVVLDSPVVVLPRNPSSAQVFVAHLGRISVNNLERQQEGNGNKEVWELEVRDMNLYSLDTGTRRVPGPVVPRADQLYSCESLAEPVLHDTVLQLRFVREMLCALDDVAVGCLLDAEDVSASDWTANECLEVTGSVVNALRVSLTRSQYEQLLDTFRSLSVEKVPDKVGSRLPDINEDAGPSGGVPHARAGLFSRGAHPRSEHPRQPPVERRQYRQLMLKFELAEFIVELRQGSKAVDLSLSEFMFSCERTLPHETNLQVGSLFLSLSLSHTC